MWSLFQSQDDLPPPPPRSSIYVMRNGRYEPQNLMPVMPRPDILDFDGFVLRRGSANSRSRIRPPDLRQASLVKNPVSVRKGSVRVRKLVPTPTSPRSADQGAFVLSCLFDALSPGTLSIFLGVMEVEHNDTVPGGPVQRRIELLSQETVPGMVDEEQKREPARPFHEIRFEAGQGQVFDSPPWSLRELAEENQSLDFDRPEAIPIVLRLIADAKAPDSETLSEDSKEPERCIHYTYVTLPKAAASSSSDSTGLAGPELGDPEPAASPSAEAEEGFPPSTSPAVAPDSYQALSSQVYLQKLEHSGQCFILHEVFGAGPSDKQAGDSAAARRPSLADADVEGNPDCVICLSEPRDTAVLPCRHMCFCSYCAGIVRLQCDRCPVCRQKVQSLLQFKRHEGKEGGGYTTESADPSVPVLASTS
eukprot:TRINITY_DN45361_c0_g1_i1.p1 TRINITY_DN45361_c0_g1~~TRINITY_DN45361_c0_g1_i1.p1  ORF type:complete len:420 (+),score=59.39 TRINITY_DN45361_c0_g1_i1:89-1348(+)